MTAVSKPDESAHERCLEHRSMAVQVKASLTILSLTFAGIFYQVFIQLPALDKSMTQQMSEQKLVITELKKDKESLERRVAMLERIRH